MIVLRTTINEGVVRVKIMGIYIKKTMHMDLESLVFNCTRT